MVFSVSKFGWKWFLRNGWNNSSKKKKKDGISFSMQIYLQMLFVAHYILCVLDWDTSFLDPGFAIPTQTIVVIKGNTFLT